MYSCCCSREGKDVVYSSFRVSMVRSGNDMLLQYSVLVLLFRDNRTMPAVAIPDHIVITLDVLLLLCFLPTAAPNRACLIAARSDYSRSKLGFKSYALSVNISDNGTPVQWAVRQFTLVVESTNDNPPSPGTKTVVVNTLNGVFNDVPLGNVNVDDPDDWDLSDETFQFDTSSAQDSYFA